jgi:hypothetical protein
LLPTLTCMGGGVLLVVLAVVWVAILVPMLLSRHDKADETKQVARFRRAMNSLSREDKNFDPLRLRRNAAVREAAARRRRITIGVLAIVLAAFVAAAMGYIPVLMVVPAVGLLLLWTYLAGRAAARIPKQLSARTDDRPIAATPRTRYVTPTPSWALKANQEVYDTDEVEHEDELAATGTEGGSWAPVPIPEPRHVRASGVSGDVIARASSWSRAVLNDVRTRSAGQQTAAPEYVEPRPRVQTAPPPAPRPQQTPTVYLDEDPPTAEIPIIRHAAG